MDWPGFRGIAAVDDHAALPLHWSVPDAKAVRWRVPVTGLGHSSPIVWGDQVCTASAVSGKPDPQLKVGLYGDIGSVLDTTSHRCMVMCFDKKTGARRWERTATTGVPSVKRHPKSTHASSTLATNGRHLVAFFGSEGLYAYDLAGELLCKKEVGTLDSGFCMTGGADIPVPTPITGHDLVFITNAHGRMSPIYSIRPTASGDISLKEGETSNAHIAWSHARQRRLAENTRLLLQLP